MRCQEAGDPRNHVHENPMILGEVRVEEGQCDHMSRHYPAIHASQEMGFHSLDPSSELQIVNVEAEYQFREKGSYS